MGGFVAALRARDVAGKCSKWAAQSAQPSGTAVVLSRSNKLPPESSAVYVYSGGHADSCLKPKLPELSPAATASVPKGVSPALAYSRGCQQLALSAAFCTDPESRIESKAAMKELHSNPGLAQHLATKHSRNPYERQLDRMSVDK